MAKRRTDEEIIAAHEAKIAAVKARKRKREIAAALKSDELAPEDKAKFKAMRAEVNALNKAKTILEAHGSKDLAQGIQDSIKFIEVKMRLLVRAAAEEQEDEEYEPEGEAKETQD